MKAISVLAILVVLIAMNFAAADGPAARTTILTLSNRHVEVSVPPGWEITFTEVDEIPYLSTDNDSCFVLKLLPSTISSNARSIDDKLSAIIADHKNRGEESVESPLVENDRRFTLRIHERYRSQDHRTIDELRLYLQIGNRLLRLEMASFSHDADRIAADRKVAEDVVLSAKLRA